MSIREDMIILIHGSHNWSHSNAEKKVYKGYLEKYGFLSANSCLATKLIALFVMQ
jgi:hypothetical protein